MHWTIESSRYVYLRPPYMVMREDRVRLPHGAVIDDYFVFEYPDWVIVLPVTDEGNLVLVRQYRHGIGEVHWELAAGVADADVPLEESARRELLEETGYGGGHWSGWLVASANPGTHTNLGHVYLAEGVVWQSEQQLDDTEDIAVGVFSPAEVRELLDRGEIVQALHAAALWKWFALRHIQDFV